MRPLLSLIPCLVATCSFAADNGYANLPDKPRFLGVEMSPTSTQTQEREGLSPHQGVQIQSVFTGTAAAKAGLSPGDVVLAINGAPLSSMTDLRNEVSMSNIGQKLNLTIARNGQLLDKETVVQEWPPHIPFEPIDAASEQMFRDWQDKRLAEAKEEARQLQADLDKMLDEQGLGPDGKAGKQPTPDELLHERAARDAELVQGIPGANPLHGWALRFSCADDTVRLPSAPAGTAVPAQAATDTAPIRLGVSITTPDAIRTTL